jgi:hypothetical protein
VAQSVCLGVLESHLSIYTILALLDNEYRVVVSITVQNMVGKHNCEIRAERLNIETN